MRAAGRCKCTKKEKAHWQIMAYAFSGHCLAIPCQVRDETYIKVKGNWAYLYRAVDKFGKTLDFMLSERRNAAAATLFFAKALSTNGIPVKIAIDKSGANTAGIRGVHKILKRIGCQVPIAPIRSKYLNHCKAG